MTLVSTTLQTAQTSSKGSCSVPVEVQPGMHQKHKQLCGFVVGNEESINTVKVVGFVCFLQGLEYVGPYQEAFTAGLAT